MRWAGIVTSFTTTVVSLVDAAAPDTAAWVVSVGAGAAPVKKITRSSSINTFPKNR